MDYNSKVYAELESSIETRKITAHDQSFRVKSQKRTPRFPSFSPPFGGDHFVTGDIIVTPDRIKTCINDDFNAKFCSNITKEQRMNTYKEYLDFLKKEFSYVDSSYFDKLSTKEGIESIDGLYWLINSYDRIRIIISQGEIRVTDLKAIDGTPVDIDAVLIYKSSEDLTENSVKNWIQFLLEVRDISLVGKIPWISFLTRKLFFYIIEDKGSIGVSSDIFISKNHQHTTDICSLILNSESRRFLRNRIYEPIPPSTFILLNTYRTFQLTKLSPIDRKKICVLGGMVKSLWGISITMDVDFLISTPQEDNPLRFRPNLGIEGVFDDFGFTFIHDEVFYCPEDDKNYKERQAMKFKDYPSTEKLASYVYKKECSGLRINRYWRFFKFGCDNILEKEDSHIESLDDVPWFQGFHMEMWGIKFMRLDFEIIRDFIKTIDMGRISKKQMYHFHNFQQKYSGTPFFKEVSENTGLAATLYAEDDWTDEQIYYLQLNLYHVDTDKDYVKRVLIRKPRKSVNIEIASLVKNLPIVKVTDKNASLEDHDKVYENVYLSSIPPTIEDFFADETGSEINAKWIVAVLPSGKVNVKMQDVSEVPEDKLSENLLTLDFCRSFSAIAVMNFSGEEIFFSPFGDFPLDQSLFGKIFEIHQREDSVLNI